jgi:hypothetical protein
MRLFVVLIIALGAALPVRAAVPPLLADAIQKVLADANRWAFTQTIVEENGKGEETKRTVVRYDPSKTYADQYVVLSVNGKPPSESDRSKYRRRGERRGERMEKAESEGRTDTVGSRQSLGELMDLDGATQAAEDRTSVMFEVPLRKEGNKRLPPEKFLVLARVNKTSRAFERVEVKLREPLRAALVVIRVWPGPAAAAVPQAAAPAAAQAIPVPRVRRSPPAVTAATAARALRAPLTR